ncbi:MAG: tRNA 2-thiouridine(34) synthase MnmA [Eubacteriales bacterium]|nr:tRNA 2-thiouridine(34) synthase MnmA [Eubacteriales bacterium]
MDAEETKGKKTKKALVAMSGGVDSSVAAMLMCREGYECVGMTMKLYENQDVGLNKGHTCCALDDVEDARSVAVQLGMKYYVLNFREDFSQKVIDRFVAAYERGDTPNPCIDCNRYMKFSGLYQRARMLDCQCIVTGHYARVEYHEGRGRWLLKKAKNKAKDQSYVLYFMTQEQLAHTRFPLGEFETKEEVRALADQYHFVNARKHDSQDICFVPNGNYGDFLERRTGKTYQRGAFVDRSGRVLGEHKGIIRYTVGQRRGLGLSLPAPLYVWGKDMEKNQVILAPEKELFTSELTAEDFNWIACPPPKEPMSVTAKTRYSAREVPAKAQALPDGRVRVVFDEPVRAVTSGQAVVLYQGDVVAGGGTICQDR